MSSVVQLTPAVSERDRAGDLRALSRMIRYACAEARLNGLQLTGHLLDLADGTRPGPCHAGDASGYHAGSQNQLPIPSTRASNQLVE